MDKMLQWTFWLGQNVTVNVVNLDVTSRQRLVAVEDPSVMLVQISRECTPPYLSTGIWNQLQPAQAEVVLGQRSTYLASWVSTRPIAAWIQYSTVST